MAIFDNVAFYLPSSLPEERREELKYVLVNNGAKEASSLTKATHIITDTNKFEGCQSVADGVAVVTDLWVERSIILDKIQLPSHYSTDPAMIFSGVIACATELPATDLEVLSAGITALGGQWRTALTRDVTHLFSISKSSPKYATAMHFKDQTNVHIVLPHWFDDSVRLGARDLPVETYEWPDPPLLQNSAHLLEDMSKPKKTDRASRDVDPEKQAVIRSFTLDPSSVPSLETLDSLKTAPPRNIWNSQRILLSPSLELNSARRLAFEAGITRSGGIIIPYRTNRGDGTKAEELENISKCDILVTRWRSGRAYVRAVRENKTIGTLGWLFYVQATGIVSRPMDQLLHYPVPKNPIEGFMGHEITVTNYTGEAREYLKKLITTMGGTFTPSMSGRNTVLIAAYLSGTKTTKAAAWSIPIVNHTWLEDCFVKWRNLTVGLEKYIIFPPGMDFSKLLGQRGVGGGFAVAGAADRDGIVTNAKDGGVGVGGWIGLETEEELEALEREDDEYDVEMGMTDEEGSVGGEVDRPLVIGQTSSPIRKKNLEMRVEEEYQRQENIKLPSLSPATPMSANEAREVEAVVDIGQEDDEIESTKKKQVNAKKGREEHKTDVSTRNGRDKDKREALERMEEQEPKDAVPMKKSKSTNSTEKKTGGKKVITYETTKVSHRETQKAKRILEDEDSNGESEHSEKLSPRATHVRSAKKTSVKGEKVDVKQSKRKRVVDDDDEGEEDKRNDHPALPNRARAGKKVETAKVTTKSSKEVVAKKGQKKVVEEDEEDKTEDDDDIVEQLLHSKAKKGEGSKKAGKDVKGKDAKGRGKEKVTVRKEEEEESTPAAERKGPTRKSDMRKKEMKSAVNKTEGEEGRTDKCLANDAIHVHASKTAKRRSIKSPPEDNDDNDEILSKRKPPPKLNKGDSSPLSSPPRSSNAAGRSSKRNAAVKAFQRLHDEVMPDMNSFQNEMRRGRISLGPAEEAASRTGTVSKSRKRKGVDVDDEVDDGEPVESTKRRRKVSLGGSIKEEEEAVSATDPKIKLMTTQVTLSDDVTKALIKLGVRITTRPMECTHLLAPGIVRTEKFLCALAGAPFVLSEKWATESAAAKKLLPENDYLLHDKAGEDKFSFKLKVATEKARKSGRKLFANKTFYITPKVPVSISLLKNVISACGGQVATTTPTARIINANPGRHVISCPEDASIWRPIAEHYPIYTQELVLTGALKQSIDWDDEAFQVAGSF
ncbi:hypothetical protein AX17_006918 [Amanita inopinata Kibby_2008]|nr:hypothetical protein AX17_006918 [Amanita inopinata Kibby_2008]